MTSDKQITMMQEPCFSAATMRKVATAAKPRLWDDCWKLVEAEICTAAENGNAGTAIYLGPDHVGFRDTVRSELKKVGFQCDFAEYGLDVYWGLNWPTVTREVGNE